MRRSFLLAAIPAVAVIASACGSSSKTTTTAPAATTPSASTAAPTTSAGTKVSVASVDGLGPVLVNSEGKVLYTFVPDNAKKVTCVGGCAAIWPPLSAPAGAKPSMSGQINGTLVFQRYDG